MTFDILKSAASSAAIVSWEPRLAFGSSGRYLNNLSLLSIHRLFPIIPKEEEHTSVVVAWTFLPQNADDVLYLPFDYATYTV